jgi:hypothetical protein
MTFEQVEASAPNGFHDAILEKLAVDYQAGIISLSMRLLVGTPGMEDEEAYSPAELRVNRLLFCAIEPPDPSYPFAPDGNPLDVSGARGLGDTPEMAKIAAQLPADASCYRFFVEQWNSFIYIAGSDIQLSLNLSDSVPRAGAC